MLEYVFIAETTNGTIIKQTPDDRSLLDPLNRSSFYDVLHCGTPVKKLTLIGKGHTFSVDMTDGHIEVDGRYFYTKKPPEHALLTPIYYRQMQQHTGVEFEVRPDGVAEDPKKARSSIRYFIGWQTNYKGKNYKFEMGVD